MTYRFGFKQNHINLLGQLIAYPEVAVANAQSAAALSKKWAKLVDGLGRPLTQAEFEVYTDGAHKLETIAASVATGCAEAEACSRANFA